MKIGFSLSMCVMDIYEKKVEFDDVFLIQSGTKIEDISEEYVTKIVKAYEWDGRMWGVTDDTVAIMRKLLTSGKVYQPRVQGHAPTKVNFNQHWADLAPTLLSEDENVKQAWNQYQVVLRLASENKPVMPAHLKKREPIDESKLPSFDDNF